MKAIIFDSSTLTDSQITRDTSFSKPPSWLCVKKGNVGFWAGCGARTNDGYHDFSPGSRATTIKDFGSSKVCASSGYLKPGSECLYNHIGAFGISSKPATIFYEARLKTTGADEEYLLAVSKDWSSYQKLDGLGGDTP